MWKVQRQTTGRKASVSNEIQLWNPHSRFFEFKGSFGLKSEYGPLEAFCDSGEAFWGGAKTTDERRALLVQP